MIKNFFVWSILSAVFLTGLKAGLPLRAKGREDCRMKEFFPTIRAFYYGTL